MSPPSAVRPSADIRLGPADGRALLNEVYDLRGRDGKVICGVPRDKAEQGIAAGQLELWRGRHGAYLRPVALSYPGESRALNINPDSRHTLHGREAVARGNPSALYDHNRRACANWTRPSTAPGRPQDPNALRTFATVSVVSPQITRAMTTRWNELTGHNKELK